MLKRVLICYLIEFLFLEYRIDKLLYRDFFSKLKGRDIISEFDVLLVLVLLELTKNKQIEKQNKFSYYRYNNVYRKSLIRFYYDYFRSVFYIKIKFLGLRIFFGSFLNYRQGLRIFFGFLIQGLKNYRIDLRSLYVNSRQRNLFNRGRVYYRRSDIYGSYSSKSRSFSYDLSRSS